MKDSRNMLPCPPTTDSLHCGSCDSVSSGSQGDGQSSSLVSAKIPNVLVGHFGVMAIFSALWIDWSTWMKIVSFGANGRSIPALLNHVSHIIERVSQKQVKRIHARRIVASVESLKTIWDGSVLNRPRNSRCNENTAPYSERAVSVFSYGGSLPNPTRSDVWNMNWNRTILVHLRPKSFLVRLSQFGNRASSHIEKSFSLLVSVFRWLSPPENALNFT